MTDKTKTTEKKPRKSFKEIKALLKPNVTKKEAQKHWYPSRNDKRYDFKEE